MHFDPEPTRKIDVWGTRREIRTLFPQRSSRDGTPFYRYSMDAVERIFEKVAGADQREAQIVLALRAEGGAGDGGDSGFFQEKPLHFFSREAGVFDVDPGVERAFWRVAAEAGNLGERVDEEIAAKSVFGDHGFDGVGGVAKRFDRCNLGELCGAGEGVENQQIHGVDDFDGGNGVAETPAGHGKTF